jgi:hypothetical protein
MDSAKIVLELMTFFVAMVKRIAEAVDKFGTEYDAQSLEAFIEEQTKALGAVIFEVCWKLRLQGQTAPENLPCECGHHKRLRGKRPRVLRLILGLMNVEERRYYRCDHCKAVGYWGDELRGMTDFSKLAEDRIALAGKEGAYQRAAKLLERLGLLKIAGSTVRKVCLKLGQRVCTVNDHLAALQHCQDLKPEEKVARMAISVDGVMVGRVDPQHRRRQGRQPKRKVRGKGRLKHFFQEVKTLVVFDFNPAGEAVRKTYYATQERVENFREKVLLEARRRGAEAAKVLVFLGDGAPWVWKTAQELFPQAIQILDWYHAMEHVWAVGRAKFKSNEVALEAWVRHREEELWNGKTAAVLKAIQEISKQLGTPNPKLSEAAKAFDPRWIAFRNVGYFKTNQARMNYPLYRQQNLPLGSGVVESSCKHVVGTRLKGPGMRWDEPGAEAILALRCEDLNERWDGIWSDKMAV